MWTVGPSDKGLRRAGQRRHRQHTSWRQLLSLSLSLQSLRRPSNNTHIIPSDAASTATTRTAPRHNAAQKVFDILELAGMILQEHTAASIADAVRNNEPRLEPLQSISAVRRVSGAFDRAIGWMSKPRACSSVHGLYQQLQTLSPCRSAVVAFLPAATWLETRV